MKSLSQQKEYILIIQEQDQDMIKRNQKRRQDRWEQSMLNTLLLEMGDDLVTTMTRPEDDP
jgi:hypothetical protein